MWSEMNEKWNENEKVVERSPVSDQAAQDSKTSPSEMEPQLRPTIESQEDSVARIPSKFFNYFLFVKFFLFILCVDL